MDPGRKTMQNRGLGVKFGCICVGKQPWTIVGTFWAKTVCLGQTKCVAGKAFFYRSSWISNPSPKDIFYRSSWISSPSPKDIFYRSSWISNPSGPGQGPGTGPGNRAREPGPGPGPGPWRPKTDFWGKSDQHFLKKSFPYESSGQTHKLKSLVYGSSNYDFFIQNHR